MARWFDDAAKSAASREVAGIPPRGVTRRTALKRGAVVAGVAWTAPVLMQTRAYAGASMCPPATTTPCFGTDANLTVACCPTGTTTCVVNAVTGLPTCPLQGEPGGTCSNQGQGTNCAVGAQSRCNGNQNQCNGCARPNICGGEGAACDATNVCAPNLMCTTSLAKAAGRSHCRKACMATSDCNAGQICNAGFCAETCTNDGDCLGSEDCVTSAGAKVCNYDPPF